MSKIGPKMPETFSNGPNIFKAAKCFKIVQLWLKQGETAEKNCQNKNCQNIYEQAECHTLMVDRDVPFTPSSRPTICCP